MPFSLPLGGAEASITPYFQGDEEERRVYMKKEISVWYDKEVDYLEVIFERKTG